VKPVLLLAPACDGRPRERRQLDLWRVTRVDRVDGADYASVIVLNDGSAGTVRRLRQALALRAQHKELPVAVLTYLGPPRGAGASPDALANAGPRPDAVLPELGPELYVELKDEVLSVEYQAD